MWLSKPGHCCFCWAFLELLDTMHQHVDETKGLNWKRVIASSSCAQVLNLMLLLVLTTCWASLTFRILPNSGPLMPCVWNQGSNSGCWTPAAKTPVTPSSRFTFISSNLFSQRIKVNKLKMLSGLNLRRTFTTTPASQHKKKNATLRNILKLHEEVFLDGRLHNTATLI